MPKINSFTSLLLQWKKAFDRISDSKNKGQFSDFIIEFIEQESQMNESLEARNERLANENSIKIQILETLLTLPLPPIDAQNSGQENLFTKLESPKDTKEISIDSLLNQLQKTVQDKILTEIPEQIQPSIQAMALPDLSLKLQKSIQKLNFFYHNFNQSLIPDTQYDQLFRAAQDLEQKIGTQQGDLLAQIGASVSMSQLKKIKHPIPMRSLDNAFSEDELIAFAHRIEKEIEPPIAYFCEPKIDGVALSLIYQQGQLQQAATRGDGSLGEDVLHNIQHIPAIPNQLQTDEPYLEIRGEIHLSKESFQALNQAQLENDKVYSNARNSASGLLRSIHSDKDKLQYLSFTAYQLLLNPEGQPNHEAITSQSEAIAYLKHLGIPTHPQFFLDQAITQCFAFCQKLNAQKDGLNYDIDGVVMKVNSFEHQHQLSHKARSPRWAIAYKFPERLYQTQLLGVHWQISRNGILTPVGQLKPVLVDGATITYATLHNFSEITRLGVQIGDQVTLIRAGSVIPKITGALIDARLGNEQAIVIPVVCPTCQTTIEFKEDASYILPLCPNLSCPDRIIQALKHFTARKAMQIDYMGIEIIRSLVEINLICHPADIYNLTPQMLLALPNFQEKSANKLYQSIQKSKAPSLAQFIYALGIAHVGEHIAQLLAHHFYSLEKLMQADIETLQSIDGIGDVAAASLVEYFQNQQCQANLQALLTHITIIVPPRPADLAKSPSYLRRLFILKGIRAHFVITGKLNQPRHFYETLIKAHHGVLSTQITRQTLYLILGESKRVSSKLKDAQAQGISLLKEADFLKLV